MATIPSSPSTGKNAVAALYLRVSTEDQAHNASLPTQEASCRALLLPHDEPMVFRESWSGLTLDRPELDKLRDLVRAGTVQTIVIHALDRLSRDPIDQAVLLREFDRRDTEVRCVLEPIASSEEGEVLRFIHGYGKKVEARAIKERTSRGRRKRVQDGKIGGGQWLYGYDYDPLTGGRTPNDQAPIVRRLYQWAADESLSTSSLALRLNAAGIAAPRGGKWNRSTVYNILTNPAYDGRETGWREYVTVPKRPKSERRRNVNSSRAYRPEHEWVDLAHTTAAIIPGDLWGKVQDCLAEHRQSHPNQAKRVYQLSGFVRCGVCSSAYVGTRGYYRCRLRGRQLAPDGNCPGPTWNAERLDAAVWANLYEMLGDPDRLAAATAAPEIVRSEDMQAARRRVREAASKKDRLVQLLLSGRIDQDVFDRQMPLLQAGETAGREELSRLESRAEQAARDAAHRETAWEAVRRVQGQLDTLDAAGRRDLMRQLQVRVVVEGPAPKSADEWALEGDGLRFHIEGVLPLRAYNAQQPTVC